MAGIRRERRRHSNGRTESVSTEETNNEMVLSGYASAEVIDHDINSTINGHKGHRLHDDQDQEMTRSPSSCSIPLNSSILNGTSRYHDPRLAKRSNSTLPAIIGNDPGTKSVYRTDSESKNGGIGKNNSAVSSSQMTSAGTGSGSAESTLQSPGISKLWMASPSMSSNMKTPRKNLNYSGFSAATPARSRSRSSLSPPRRSSSATWTTQSLMWLHDGGGRRKRPTGLQLVTLLAVLIVTSCCSYAYMAVTLMQASTPTAKTEDGATKLKPDGKNDMPKRNGNDVDPATKPVGLLRNPTSNTPSLHHDGGRQPLSIVPRIITGLGSELDNYGRIRKRQIVILSVPTSVLDPLSIGTQRHTNATLEFDLLDTLILVDDDKPSEQDLANVQSNRSTAKENDGTSLVTKPVVDRTEPLKPSHETTCLPMGEWMTASYVNCNSMHELDMGSSVAQKDMTDLVLLGQGWFRSAWRYTTEFDAIDKQGPKPSTTASAVVMKTLRLEREFLPEYFDLHRRDAVAMERLTFSPFVMDVYGYCGQSAINELAEGMNAGPINSLEEMNRRMRGRESDEWTLRLKLNLATSIAIGLAHVHNVHVSSNHQGGITRSTKRLLYGNINHTVSTTGFGDSVPTMAHYDINPRNIAIMKNGQPKLNDFNIAEFMTYNPATNETCGFPSRLHEPWWRAPEEMDLSHTTRVTEKVDVYALGNVLFHILTTHSPRGKMKKERMDEVRNLVRAGERPKMLEPYASGTLKKHRIVKAFVKAMDLCYEKDPQKRGTSIQVARVLHKALLREEKDDKTKSSKRDKNETGILNDDNGRKLEKSSRKTNTETAPMKARGK